MPWGGAPVEIHSPGGHGPGNDDTHRPLINFGTPCRVVSFYDKPSIFCSLEGYQIITPRIIPKHPESSTIYVAGNRFNKFPAYIFSFRISLPNINTDKEHDHNNTRHRQRTHLNHDTRYSPINFWHLGY